MRSDCGNGEGCRGGEKGEEGAAGGGGCGAQTVDLHGRTGRIHHPRDPKKGTLADLVLRGRLTFWFTEQHKHGQKPR